MCEYCVKTTPEQAHRIVDWAIKELGLKPPLTDEELDKELEDMLSQFPKDTQFGKLMGEARRKFLYRKDLDIVAKRLKEKCIKSQKK